MLGEQTGDSMFQPFTIFIGIVFVIVVGLILIPILRGILQWRKNNLSPKLNVIAKVVTKRTAIWGGGHTHANNDYFVTFEMESGVRMEFEVNDSEYGMLVEGDKGQLLIQGTRFLDFYRILPSN